MRASTVTARIAASLTEDNRLIDAANADALAVPAGANRDFPKSRCFCLIQIAMQNLTFLELAGPLLRDRRIDAYGNLTKRFVGGEI